MSELTDGTEPTEELSPRERRHLRTQQAILDAARAIIAKEGTDKLSMRAIADKIDYSPAGLYEYYGSKEEIIREVSLQGHRTLKRYLAAVDRAVPEDQYLVDLGMAYVRFALQNPDYFLLMFSQVTTVDATMPATTVPAQEMTEATGMMSEDSSFPILVEGIQRAQAAGVIRYLPGLTLMDTAYAFWAVAHGAAMLRVSHLREMQADFDSADRRMFEAFTRGLRL
jgi:AcrR family transcriptional regulator